ncbi:MAG: hypothetical protein DDT20_00830 [Firmicutes bacterium]|nr:hypothetical protein [Bacillota bacterium]
MGFSISSCSTANRILWRMLKTVSWCKCRSEAVLSIGTPLMVSLITCFHTDSPLCELNSAVFDVSTKLFPHMRHKKACLPCLRPLRTIFSPLHLGQGGVVVFSSFSCSLFTSRIASNAFSTYFSGRCFNISIASASILLISTPLLLLFHYRIRNRLTNQLYIRLSLCALGVACDRSRILCIFEGCGKPSQKKTYESFKDHIAVGSTLIHDKENAHKKLVRELQLNSIAYDSRKIKLQSDKDNPLNRVNRIHNLFKRFLYAHTSFNRDRIQGYLNLFAFVINPPENHLEKVETLLDLAFQNPKTLRYREFYGVKQ